MLGIKINQSGAAAQGDIIGGDKTNITNNFLATPAGKAQRFMQLLEEEMLNKVEIKHVIDGLQFFYTQRSLDGIDGLEAKLQHASKEDEIILAYEKKELFVKMLDKFGKYSSAQRLFAYLLAKIDNEFNSAIHPQIDYLTRADIAILTAEKIVNPIVDECGFGPVDINHHIVMGMLYWLAEQCFVRWHQ